MSIRDVSSSLTATVQEPLLGFSATTAGRSLTSPATSPPPTSLTASMLSRSRTFKEKVETPCRPSGLLCQKHDRALPSCFASDSNIPYCAISSAETSSHGSIVVPIEPDDDGARVTLRSGDTSSESEGWAIPCSPDEQLDTRAASTVAATMLHLPRPLFMFTHPYRESCLAPTLPAPDTDSTPSARLLGSAQELSSANSKRHAPIDRRLPLPTYAERQAHHNNAYRVRVLGRKHRVHPSAHQLV